MQNRSSGQHDRPRTSLRHATFIGFTLFLCCGCFQTRLPGRSFVGSPSAPTTGEASLEEALRRHVAALAGEIGERNVTRKYDGLNEAANHVERAFKEAGYDVASQDYFEHGKPVRNLIAELPGSSLAGEIIIVGAHYDTVPGSPGADDNASGISGMLELAKAMRGDHPARTVRFVAFTNEEQPYFWTRRMGSRVYARACRERGDKIVAMISLEMLGCFDDRPESQHYPPPFGLIYPHAGNFIAFLADAYSSPLLDRVGETFRRSADIGSMGLASAQFVTGQSDQWSFWWNDYRAIMATDTALFRNPRYHRPSDTPDTLDYRRMSIVVKGMIEVVRDLGSEAAPADYTKVP